MGLYVHCCFLPLRFLANDICLIVCSSVHTMVSFVVDLCASLPSDAVLSIRGGHHSRVPVLRHRLQGAKCHLVLYPCRQCSTRGAVLVPGRGPKLDATRACG